MAKRSSHVALISALLVSVCLKASVAQNDWVSDLTSSINQRVHHFTEQLQTQIQHMQQNLQSSLAEVNKALENLPRDANGSIINGQMITNSGSTILVNGNGVSKSIISGYSTEGEPFVRVIEERREDNFLYHTETIYKPRTKSSETIRWKLDLATPGAKPEIITDDN